ncbi:MAG: hypothetical protein GY938_25700 [Ketobacter sp.]|nr:hypothetical protein [Ketobacter sp.]
MIHQHVNRIVVRVLQFGLFLFTAQKYGAVQEHGAVLRTGWDSATAKRLQVSNPPRTGISGHEMGDDVPPPETR